MISFIITFRIVRDKVKKLVLHKLLVLQTELQWIGLTMQCVICQNVAIITLRIIIMCLIGLCQEPLLCLLSLDMQKILLSLHLLRYWLVSELSDQTIFILLIFPQGRDRFIWTYKLKTELKLYLLNQSCV